jgi:cellulose biosynthesis protein BcsQ
MTHIYDIHSYKGGVGVTTTACSLALILANKGHSTLLVDSGYSPDTYPWLNVALPIGSRGEVAKGVFANLDMVRIGDSEKISSVNVGDYDFVVIDNGRNCSQEYPTAYTVQRVCVVRNEYMSLHNTANRFAPRTELLVAFIGEGLALTAKDVQNVLNREPVVASIDTNAQRAIDAGLAPMRVDERFGWVKELLV